MRGSSASGVAGTDGVIPMPAAPTSVGATDGIGSGTGTVVDDPPASGEVPEVSDKAEAR